MYCSLGLLLTVVALGQTVEAVCYNFTENSYLKFSPSHLNISHSVHYNLKFRTTESSGILLYLEGRHDYEALFIYNGRLVYLLTNPSPSGVEGTSGGLYQGDIAVNDGSWYMVELWRNWEIRHPLPRTDVEIRTGMVIYNSAGYELESHIDNLNHRGVVLHPSIFVGGIGSSVIHARNSPVPPFKGQIKEMKEERNELDFSTDYFNYEARVKVCS